MAFMKNRAQIAGNLGADPEVRFQPSGAAVCNIRIATTERWRDKTTGEKREKTEWHRVVLFNRTAEIAGEYLKKGSPVYIEGKIQTRKWQDKSGQDRWTTEIVATEMQMIGPAPGGDSSSSGGHPVAAGASGGNGPDAARNAAKNPPSYADDDDDDFDDVPF